MSSSGLNLEKYRIPLDEILRVTRNFSPETLIGDGGFGMVHVGQLSEEWQNSTVAIKRLNNDGHQGKTDFHNELKMVSSFHHPNIITFIGYCDEANEMIIVYDYAKNGSLDRHFQKPDKMRKLTWAHRLKICLGATKGLKYLHSGLGEHNKIIHRDVESANILLDDNLKAKICDFGLSRFGAQNEDDSQILTRAAGTRYYMDPLYAERSRLTKKSDVYSFGVVMFEMSSGTLVYHEKCFGDDAKRQYLIDVVRSCYDDDEKAAGPDKLINPIIKDHTDMKSFHEFNRIAHECVNLKIEKRPMMERIIRKIDQALKIQLTYELPSTITIRSLESYLIPLKEIELATENFNPKTRIGSDEFGAVHSGQLYTRWENRTMAIRRLYPESYKEEHEFYNELRIISSFRHQNISLFIGYCDEANERIIVHERPVKGYVAYHMAATNMTPHLTWAQRLRICVGVARGLQCLHLALGEDNSVTRGNTNCESILLDENMDAKICFFGLSRQGSMDRKLDVYTSGLQKSDMYSFGVIMFRMLTWKRAYIITRSYDITAQIDILEKFYNNNGLDKLIDEEIRDQIDSRCLKIYKEIAYRCITRDHTESPRWIGRGTPVQDAPATLRMDEVVERLEDAADFQGVEV